MGLNSLGYLGESKLGPGFLRILNSHMVDSPQAIPSLLSSRVNLRELDICQTTLSLQRELHSVATGGHLGRHEGPSLSSHA